MVAFYSVFLQYRRGLLTNFRKLSLIYWWNMNIKQAIETTRNLNANDKALLAHCLISSLETSQDVDVDNAWAELSEKRYSELVSGTVESVSWQSIKKSVRF